MNLTPNKWLPETLIRIINKGETTLELQMSVAPLKDVYGKKITILPGKQFVKVADLIPAHIKNYHALLPKNIFINIKDRTNSPIQISIEEFGPYVSSINESQYQNAFDLYMAKCNEALKLKDNFRIEKLLEVEAQIEPNVNLSNLISFIYIKARMFHFAQRFEECDHYYERLKTILFDNRANVEDSTILFYYTTHAEALMDAAIAGNKNIIDKRYKFLEKAHKLYNSAEEYLPKDEFLDLYKWSFNCRKAFCLCFVGETNDAINLIEYYAEPLPISFIKNPQRHSFFANITYGLLVALELKSEKLIRQITKFISTGHEDMNEEFNAIIAMRRGISNLEENGQPSMFIVFKNLLLIGGNIENEFPNLTDFLRRLGSNNEERLNKYLLEF